MRMFKWSVHATDCTPAVTNITTHYVWTPWLST